MKEDKKEISYDVVNNPKHYTNISVECIDIMQELFGSTAVSNFCLCNAFKYIWRSEFKENKLQDIKKANSYLNKYISLNEPTNN